MTHPFCLRVNTLPFCLRVNTLRKSMEKIELQGVLPRVFEADPPSDSQVWLRDICFSRGGRYLVEAPSGTGKSSLCAYIYGNRRDFRGRILFDGQDTASFRPQTWQRLRRTCLAYLPQELDLFPELTAMQNIELKRALTGHTPAAQVKEWIEAFGLAERAHFPVGKMSIGQQQRVAIIRALCQPFSFLLIDEPVSHLDDANNTLAASIIEAEATRQEAGVIATSVGNRIGLRPDSILQL